MLLIPIDSEGQLADNGWKEVPEFGRLYKKFGAQGMKVVVMTWDSYSSYRKLKEETRAERVAKMYFGQKWEAFLQSEEYQDAKFLYIEMDYDPLFEQQAIYMDKMREINDEIKRTPFTEANSDKIRDYTKLQTSTSQELGRIQERIEARGVEKKDFEGKKMSGIEIFQERARKRKNEETVFRNKMQGAKTDAELGIPDDDEPPAPAVAQPDIMDF